MALTTHPTDPPVVGAAGLGELYEALAGRLQQIVRSDVRAPEPVVEDACQFAWSRLVHHADRVRREAVLSWLTKTAIHEAFKLIRRDRRELSLDLDLELDRELDQPGAEATLGARTPLPEELVEQRERLEMVRTLPDRQQRVMWMHALGLTYSEIAERADCTPRTVERQLMRARRAVRAAEREL
jgi:RNA polymerase sigma factor (sigma-70 family)